MSFQDRFDATMGCLKHKLKGPILVGMTLHTAISATKDGGVDTAKLVKDCYYKVPDNYRVDLETEVLQLMFDIDNGNFQEAVEFSLPYLAKMFNMTPWECLEKYYEYKIKKVHIITRQRGE